MTVKKTLINLIQAFCISFAFFNISGMESGNILLLIVFGLSAFLLTKEANKEFTKKVTTVSVVISIIFTLLYMIGGYDRIGGGLENRLYVAVYIFFTALGLLSLFYHILRPVLTYCMSHSLEEEKQGVSKDAKGRTFSFKIWGIYSGIIFLCMIPVFLMNFPGIMTPDSIVQYLQATHVESYSNHHPWMHTLFIEIFYKIGFALTGIVNGGIATYTIFQMILVSAGVGYAIECLYEMKIKKIWRVTALLVFVLLPYNLIYGVTMWKDVLFSVGTLCFTVTLTRILLMNKRGARDIIIFFVSGFAFCEFRHNGYYAYLITAVAVVMMLIVRYFKAAGVAKNNKTDEKADVDLGTDTRKSLVIYPFIFIVLAIITSLINGPLMKAFDVEQTPSYMSLSIPLQQMARVVYDEKDLDDADLAMLERINDLDYVRNNYCPGGSDNICQWVAYGDEEYLMTHMSDYVALWFRIGIRYPGEYIAAYIDQTKGYFYPMNPEQTVFYDITDNSVGLESEPLINGPAVVKLEELMFKLHTMIPAYGVLYSPGSFFWLMILFMGIVICREEKNKLFLFLPVLGVTLTILAATPLVADLRYAYELMITLPYLALISCKRYTE